MGGRPRHKLTAIAIKAAGPGRLQDGAGLMLERSPAGGSWVYRYSLDGRRREMGLGPWPDLSLAEARKARDRWAAVLVGGADPIAERERLRDEERAARAAIDPTLAEAVAQVFAAIAPTLRDGGTRGRWLSPLAVHVLPAFGRRRVSRLTPTDLKDALKPIWQGKPATGEKAIQRLGVVFRRGRLMGMPCHEETVERARHLLGDAAHVPGRIAATRWQDVPALYARLTGLGPSHLALRLLILTAARSWPVRGMRFGEVDGDVWTVPAERMKGTVKTARDFRVPLAPEALVVLALAQEAAEGDLCFAGTRGGPVSDVALQQALNDLGEAGRPHGFRSSFRSWVQDNGACSREVAEMALAHKVYGEVEERYARSDMLDQRREALAAWAAHVTNAKSPPGGA